MAGSVPTASTSVTVLGLLHVINTMVPVAQAVTRTGLDLPVNIVRAVRVRVKLFNVVSQKVRHKQLYNYYYVF